MRRHHRFIAATVLPVALSCAGQPPRFSLRAPIVHEDDAHEFTHRPEGTDEGNFRAGSDAVGLRPFAHLWTLDRTGEAHNVTAFDEVADSSWYTNRSVTVEQGATGACLGPAPQYPITITSSKFGGQTPGLFVRDALGRRYALKIDQHPLDQPELNPASDAIVARMYYALGFNTSCNTVMDVDASMLTLGPDAYYEDMGGRRHRLTPDRVARLLARGSIMPDGQTRVGMSEFVHGTPIGPFPGEGVRDDDPNDRVPHEHRRELRGERMLAAWVNHWDAREPNTLDMFEADTQTHLGHVHHYIIDFGDCLGARFNDPDLSKVSGYQYVADLGLANIFTLGITRRVYEDIQVDPRAPVAGYFEYEHFSPGDWVPLLPNTRYLYADERDMAWMARKIARYTDAHLVATFPSAHLSDPQLSDRLHEVLVHRRERLLRWSFDRVSPVTDFVVHDRREVCAADLAVESGLETLAGTTYGLTFRRGADHTVFNGTLEARATDTRGGLCVQLPEHMPSGGSRDDVSRYATLDLARMNGGHSTRLRAHFYDLGPERGYRLVGIER